MNNLGIISTNKGKQMEIVQAVTVYYIVDNELKKTLISEEYLLQGQFRVPFTEKVPLQGGKIQYNDKTPTKLLNTLYRINPVVYLAGVDEDEIEKIYKMRSELFQKH